MGDRAIVAFKNGYESCGVYLHWDRSNVVKWVKEAAPKLRRTDPGYAAARFAQFCANKLDEEANKTPELMAMQVTGIGLVPDPYDGDGETFMVNLDTGDIESNERGVIATVDPLSFSDH